MRSSVLFSAAAWLALTVPPVHVHVMGSVALAAPLQGAVEANASTAKMTVAAVVNGTAIYEATVLSDLQRAVGGRHVDEETRPVLQAQMLGQLIDRRLVLDFLLRKRLGATKQDVDLELSRLEKRLAQRAMTLQQYAAEQGLDTAQLRQELAWRIGWPRYLQRQLTDAKLQQYFQQHRHDFDGTRLQVAHILFASSKNEQAGVAGELVAKAQAVRDEIVSGRVTFSEAAGKHSSAPTADRGGLIGFISRHEPMPESFSRTAFSLDVGHVSQPVSTVFGVHLIQCLEIVPGQRTWEDARMELRKAATRYVFDRIASAERPGSKIEFTGSMPYFSPGSGRLVVGGQDPAD